MPSPDDRTVSPLPAERTLAAPEPRTVVDSRGFRTEVQPVYPVTAPGMPSVAGYTITREIGRGGMGVVYAAYDPTFDREVAVKVMHPGQDAGRFVVEAKVTARLPHPGIPPVYSLGALADGRPYLAMKLIKGKTLAAEVNEADLPELLAAFERICETVGFAHSKGIVHRDLKPQNVMVGPFGEVLVMDWGLARFVQLITSAAGQGWETPGAVAVRASAVETIAGDVKGTPAFMAPEQARGDEIDARADVFALGGILAMILTGKPPFRGSDALDTVMRAARAELRDCFELLDECGEDPALVEMAKRALSPLPHERFASGAEVAAAVAEYRAHVQERLQRAERERAVSAAEVREQRKRRKVQLALLGTVMLLLCGAGAFALWESDQRAARTRKAEQEAAQERHRQEQADKNARDALDFAISLRGQSRFTETEQALEQSRAAAVLAGPELTNRIDRLLADTRFAKELDAIRYRKWEASTDPERAGMLKEKEAPGWYEKAFADHGLRLRDADPAASARQIAASPIKRELVAAIDDWATYEKDPPALARLLEVARRADPNPWWNTFRDPAVWRDRAALTKLAAEVKPEVTPPAQVVALAMAMSHAGLNPAPLLTAARAAHPNDFGLAFSLGLWYHARGEYGRAIGPFEAARAIRPDNQTARGNLGVAYIISGDYAGAVAIFRDCIRRDPADVSAHNNLGGALYKQENYEAAVASFREALRIDPSRADVLDNLGTGLRALGKFDEAIEAHRRACDLAPRSAKYRIDLAGVYKLKGDLARTIATLREALDLDPTNALGHHDLGNLLHQQKDYPGAVAAYKEAIRLAPKLAIPHYNLGNALRDSGDADGALAEFRRAIDLDPNFSMAHNNLGNLLKQCGEIPRALAEFQEAVRLDPRNAIAHANLADVYILQEKYDAALKSAELAVRHDPAYALGHVALGKARLKLGNIPGARAALTEATRLDKQYAPQLAEVPPEGNP